MIICLYWIVNGCDRLVLECYYYNSLWLYFCKSVVKLFFCKKECWKRLLVNICIEYGIYDWKEFNFIGNLIDFIIGI